MINNEDAEKLKKLKCPICDKNNNNCEDICLEDEDGWPAHIHILQCIDCKYGIFYNASTANIEEVIDTWNEGKNEL